MSSRTIDAPAKINLGLEILGRRADGYHEIRSVLCAVSLRDTLTFSSSTSEDDVIEFLEGDSGIPAGDNLIVKALAAARHSGADIPPQRMRLIKRIPTAAGLGGASSDAAATLLAFSPELADAGIAPTDLAPRLGSDVPFFLNGPIAMVSGRGETIVPLQAPPGGYWVILVTPTIEIAAKTQSMYASIEPDAWSSGDSIRAIAHDLPLLPATAPPNTFEAALIRRFPSLLSVRQALLDAGAPFVALTGAGPTFYTILRTRDDANAITQRLDLTDAIVNVCRLGGYRIE